MVNKKLRCMNRDELIEYLDSQGYTHIKEIPGRGLCGFRDFMFTIGVCHDLDEDGFGGRWCYPRSRMVDALIVLDIWDGEGDPPGPWVKYKGSVEYSNPKNKDK